MFAAAKDKLSKSVSFLAGRYSPAFITLLVLAGFYFFYFTVIVSKNEANLKERNFRGLQRMGNNISKKIASYVEENSKNFLKAAKKLPPGINKSLIEEQYNLNRIGPDSSIKWGHPFSIKLSDSWKFLFCDSISKKDSLVKDSLAAASVEDFINPLLRRDIFRHYYLAIGDTILMDELNNSFNSVKDYLPVSSKDIDSVKKGPLKQSGEIRKIEIEGKEYRLFLLPFITEGRVKFTLGGYMPAGDYISEQRYIPTYGILWMVIGIMLVILMFPLLKIFLMHRTEQLVARNAISSLGSIHILGSMLVLIALNTYAYFSIIRSTADVNLKNLAIGIDTVFNNEVNDALHVLDKAELELNNDTTKPVLDKSIYGEDNYHDYPFFLHISWADSTGMQKLRWANAPYTSEKINVSDRDYFLAVKNGDLWRRENEKPFYLTEVASRVENKNLAVISRHVSQGDKFRKNDSMKLMMISVSGAFRSMFNTILPSGTGFCIIKDDGNVLFHTDENRNLNENLVEECDHNTALQSLLKEKSTGYFNSGYSGSIQRFHIRPVSGMPYYIVTFRDMKPVWSEDLDVISACSIFTLLNLGVILMAILIIQVAGYKRSLLQHKSILFPWLQPNYKLITAYKSVTFVYLAAIVLQSVLSIVYWQQDQLCIAGVLFSYSFCLIGYAYYQFAVLNQPDEDKRYRESDGDKKYRKFNILFIGLVLAWAIASILFTIYLLSWGKGHGGVLFLVSQVSLGLVMFIIHLLKKTTKSQNKVAKHRKRKNTSLNTIIALLSGIMSFLRKILGTVEEKRNHRWWYVCSVFVFIIATSVVPSVIFYSISFKQERLISLKNTQLEFVNTLIQQRPDTIQQRSDTANETGDSFKFSYSTPFYFNSFADSIKKSGDICPPGDSSINNFELFYNRIKPNFSAYSTQLEYLENGDNGNNDFKWKYRGRKRQLLFHYKVTQANTYAGSSKALCVYSPVDNGLDSVIKATRRDWISLVLLFASLALLGTGFYFLLKRLITKIFFDGYNDSEHFDKFDKNNLFIRSFPDEENLFVNGLINSGKHYAIYHYFKTVKKANVEEVDIVRLSAEELKNILLELPDNFKNEKNVQPDTKNNIVLIRHFEMFMDDIKMTEAKLNLLEWLLRRKHIRIIILSSRSFESMQKKTPPDDKGQVKDYTDRCINMMNKFYNVYYQWKKPAGESGEPGLTQLKESLNEYCNVQIRYNLKDWDLSEGKRRENFYEELDEIQKYSKIQMDLFFDNLDNECSGSDLLWELRNPLLDYLKHRRVECFRFDFQFNNKSHMIKIINRHFINLYENICLRIQSLACNYYLSVWQSLTDDEQMTLYDIAMDEMVNPANRDIASRLACLGLVNRPDNVPGYQIVSKSFRNFIFTQIDKKEVNSLRNEEADKGSWSKFQLPVLITVIALGIFLFTTQKGAFTNLVAYLGATAGGIGALLRVLGMSSSSK